jgi:hypothetical protein
VHAIPPVAAHRHLYRAHDSFDHGSDRAAAASRTCPAQCDGVRRRPSTSSRLSDLRQSGSTLARVSAAVRSVASAAALSSRLIPRCRPSPTVTQRTRAAMAFAWSDTRHQLRLQTLGRLALREKAVTIARTALAGEFPATCVRELPCRIGEGSMMTARVAGKL